MYASMHEGTSEKMERVMSPTCKSKKESPSPQQSSRGEKKPPGNKKKKKGERKGDGGASCAPHCTQTKSSKQKICVICGTYLSR